MRDLIVANEDFGKVIFTNLLETNRPFPSYVVPFVSKRFFAQNVSYVNEFDLYENEPVGGTHFI